MSTLTSIRFKTIWYTCRGAIPIISAIGAKSLNDLNRQYFIIQLNIMSVSYRTSSCRAALGDLPSLCEANARDADDIINWVLG